MTGEAFFWNSAYKTEKKKKENGTDKAGFVSN